MKRAAMRVVAAACISVAGAPTSLANGHHYHGGGGFRAGVFIGPGFYGGYRPYYPYPAYYYPPPAYYYPPPVYAYPAPPPVPVPVPVAPVAVPAPAAVVAPSMSLQFGS